MMRNTFYNMYPMYIPYIPKPFVMRKPPYRYIPYRVNSVEIKTNELRYENEYIKEDLKYPELQNLNNKEVQHFINNSIKSDIMEFKRQMEEAANEYGEQAKEEGVKFDPFIISSVYQVTYDKNNIISISIIYHEYINGVNSYIKASYNFNLVNGESLSLKDLFKPGVNYQEVIDKEVKKELILNKEDYFPNAAENFKGIAEYQPFYLDNGDIVVYFGFHEIAPVASEIPVIKIPFSAVKNYVKPEYLN